MRHPRLRTALIGSGAALALVGGTAAFAVTAGPIDSSGVIHGCYYAASTGGSRKVVLQNVGTSCPSGTTAIKWNQKGPAGPQGVQGIQGPPGQQGIQGPPGPPGVVTGYVARNGGDITLPNTFTTVDTLNLPACDFLLTAKTVVFSSSLSGQDYIPCELLDGSGAEVDISFGALSPGSLGGDQQTLALTGITTAGGTIQLECFAGQIPVTATDSAITAVPLASVSGASVHRQHLPPLRSGAPVSQRG